MNKKLFWAWVLILIAVHAANIYTLKVGLQFEIDWLDIPLHYFGGIGVGFFAIWIAEHMKRGFAGPAPWWWTLDRIVFITGGVVLGWELAEVSLLYIFGLPLPVGWLTDTVKDIIIGCLGALTALGAFHAVQWKAWQEAKATLGQGTKQG